MLAQGNALLTVAPPAKVLAKANQQASAKLNVQLKSGYHVNSNSPKEEYLIPLRLTWDPGALQLVEIAYPKAKMETYEFSKEPLSVFTGDFDVLTTFKVAAAANQGPGVLTGKLRYQACTNTMCYPPASVQVRLPYEIQ